MSQKHTSFFDNEIQSKSTLWIKERSALKDVVDKSSYKGAILKFSKKSQKYRERQFILSQSKLYCARRLDSVKYIGYINIQFSTCTVERETVEDQQLYSVKFVRNNRYAKLLIRDEENLNKFKNAIKPYIIQINFHDVFEAKKLIGQGAFASVYLCINRQTKERVAVKTLSKKKATQTKEGRDLILNEIEISGSLDNPHLMKLLEVYESPSSVYMIFDLLEGGDLVSYIKTQQYLSYQDIYTIIRTLLKGLLFLQMNGILHRDIKPDNILLQRKGDIDYTQLKIVDFGLSTRTQVDYYIVNRCGTPGYIAPEILKYEPGKSPKLTFKCDVFSVDVILFHIITGRRPFIGKNVEELLKRNKECKIDFCDSRFDRITHLRDLLENMLIADPIYRICARDALNHKFFDSYIKAEDELEHYDISKFPCEMVEPVINDKKAKNVMLYMTEGLMNGNISGSGTISFGSMKLSEDTTDSG